MHQMNWPPQSTNLNPIEMVWDELDCRVNKKQPTRMPRVCKDVIKAKGGYFEESKKLNIFGFVYNFFHYFMIPYVLLYSVAVFTVMVVTP